MVSILLIERSCHGQPEVRFGNTDECLRFETRLRFEPHLSGSDSGTVPYDRKHALRYVIINVL